MSYICLVSTLLPRVLNSKYDITTPRSQHAERPHGARRGQREHSRHPRLMIVQMEFGTSLGPGALSLVRRAPLSGAPACALSAAGSLQGSLGTGLPAAPAASRFVDLVRPRGARLPSSASRPGKGGVSASVSSGGQNALREICIALLSKMNRGRGWRSFTSGPPRLS